MKCKICLEPLPLSKYYNPMTVSNFSVICDDCVKKRL